jgi:hypothetical protein
MKIHTSILKILLNIDNQRLLNQLNYVSHQIRTEILFARNRVEFPVSKYELPSLEDLHLQRQKTSILKNWLDILFLCSRVFHCLYTLS